MHRCGGILRGGALLILRRRLLRLAALLAFVVEPSSVCDVEVPMNSGSVLVPTPSPAVTRLMMPAEMATAARADTTDTAITPRCMR